MVGTIKNIVEDFFKDSPSKLKVAKKIVLYGLSVKSGKIYCNDIEIPYKSLARACGVDQRVVRSAIDSISSNKKISNIFSKFESSVNLKDVSKEIGFGVLVISAYDPKEPGIIASVSKIIADFKINIRQAIVEDPEFIEEPKLYIITEESLPGEIIPKIKNLKNIKSITIL
ncbi:MAG: regulator [Thermoplasmata archaeon]